MTKVVVYTRISRDVGLTRLGVQRQHQDCVELCEREGYTIVGEFEDDDRSAYSGKPRPGYDAMCRRIADGDIDLLVAWHPDRITRQPRELEDLIDLLESSKTSVRTVQSGEYDLSTPSGRMAARIVGAVARHESEHKAARIRRKHRQIAESGKVHGGGTRPFGYRDDRVTIREDEAAVIRDIVARILAGASLRSICKRLADDGIRTPRGNTWTLQSLRSMITAGRLAGLRENHGELVGPAVWDPIITPEDLRRVRAVLADPKRRKRRTTDRYLLTGGMAVCALCGTPLVARPQRPGQRSYVCATDKHAGRKPGCGKIRIAADDFEQYVADQALVRVDAQALAAAAENGDETAELDRIDARLAELGELWASGELDNTSWQAARQRLERDREALDAQLRKASVSASVPAPERLSGWWADESVSVSERRAVLDLLVERVEVGPAVKGRNFFDPARVKIRGRGWEV